MWRAALVAFVVSITFAWASVGRAQPAPCSPPWCFETPRVTVQTPSVDARAQAEAQARATARAQAEARAALEAQARAAAMWRAYWDWEAHVRADVYSQINARIDVELRELERDRFAGVAPPRIAAPRYGGVTLPRIELGVAGCAGTWSGRGVPLHYGFCVPVHFRLTENIGFAADPSLVWFDEGAHTTLTAGFSPGFMFSFGSAGGRLTGSHAFVSAGLDAWAPLSPEARDPHALLGAHVGVGVAAFSAGSFGALAEARALGRVGITGTDDSAVAEVVARPRVGFEVRLALVWGN